MSANHVDYWAELTCVEKSAMQEQLSDIATYNGFTQDSSIAAIAAAIMCEGMWIEYFPDIFERRVCMYRVSGCGYITHRGR